MEEKLERKIAPCRWSSSRKEYGSPSRWRLDLTDKPGDHLPRQDVHPKNLTPKGFGRRGRQQPSGAMCLLRSRAITARSTRCPSPIIRLNQPEGPRTGRGGLLQVGASPSGYHGHRGDRTYDKYEHDYIVYPYDVLFVSAKAGGHRPPVKSGWTTCTPNCPVWTALATRAASSSWPTGWATLPLPYDHGVRQGYPEAIGR